MPITRTRCVRSLLVVAALTLVAAGCANREDPLDIGIRRVALDLSFKDPEKAAPVAPRRVIRQVIYENAEYSVQQDPQRPVQRIRVVPPRSEEIECPTAPDNATPDEPAFHIVRNDVTPGSWLRHNEGTIHVTLATQEFELPVPSLTRWRIPEVETVQGSRVAQDDDVDSLSPPDAARSNTTAFPESIEFTLERQITRTTTIIDTFRYPPDGASDFLYLIKRVIKQGDNTSEFTPTPAIRYIAIGEVEGEGDVPAFGGIDRDKNIAMVVQSSVLERQWVDVCGEMVDTYRIRIQETFADLSNNTEPTLSGNQPDTYNYWNVQYHNGILIVREEADSRVQGYFDTGAGASVPITLDYKYTSTLTSTTADPPDAPAPGFSFE